MNLQSHASISIQTSYTPLAFRFRGGPLLTFYFLKIMFLYKLPPHFVMRSSLTILPLRTFPKNGIVRLSTLHEDSFVFQQFDKVVVHTELILQTCECVCQGLRRKVYSPKGTDVKKHDSCGLFIRFSSVVDLLRSAVKGMRERVLICMVKQQ